METLFEAIDKFIPGDWGAEVSSPETPNNAICIRGADIENVRGGIYNSIPPRYLSNASIEKKTLKVGDIVIEKSGGSPTQSTGRTCYISDDLIKTHEKVVCSNFCAAFRMKPHWDYKYIYYYIQNVYNQGNFFNYEGKTSGIRNLLLETAFKAITLPSIETNTQSKLVNILVKIDQKIALNTRMNAELETMAKQLYDYWFVQFDFPDENGNPYKSSGGKMVYNEKLKREIPEGWEVLIINDILDKVVSTPRLVTDEYQNDGLYPVIDQTTDVYFAGFTNRKDAVSIQYPAIVFGDHSCAVKYVNFPFVRGADGTQIMLSKNENVSVEYLYFYVKNINISKGYARHYSFVKDYPLLIPHITPAKKYNIIVKKLFNRIKQLRFENKELNRLRDSLLPMLMNGQVTVE